MGYLVLNACMYGWLIFMLSRSARPMRAATAIAVLLFFLALCSIYAYGSGVYFEEVGDNIRNEMSLAPFVYAFCFACVLLLPLSYVDRLDIASIRSELSSSIPKALLVLGVTVAAIVSVLTLPYAVAAQSMDLLDVYSDGNEYGMTLIPKYVYRLLTVYNIIHPVVLIGAFAAIGRPRRNSNLRAFGLMLAAFLPGVMVSMASASRGGMYQLAGNALFGLLISFWTMEAKLRRYVVGGVVVSLFVGFLYSMTVTVARVGEGGNPVDSIARYFGESFLNVALVYWGNAQEYLYGSRYFPDIYLFVTGGSRDAAVSGGLGVTHLIETRITGVPMQIFKNIAIDAYIEFGYFGGCIFFGALTWLLRARYLHKKRLGLQDGIIMLLYFQICFSSWITFYFKGHDRNVVLVGSLMLAYIIGRSLRKAHA